MFSLLKNAEETNQPNSLFSYFILEYKILPTVDQLLKKFKVALYYYFSYFQSLWKVILTKWLSKKHLTICENLPYNDEESMIAKYRYKIEEGVARNVNNWNEHFDKLKETHC